MVITTMVAPSISNDSNSFRGSVSIKANFKGRLQIVDDSGFQSISMTYGGISVNKSNKLSNVLDFTAGSAISVAGHMHPMDAARVGALGIVLAE